MRDGLTILRHYGSVVEAEMAANMLDAYGIECVIDKDDAGGMYPQMGMLGMIRLLVRDEDVDEARDLLEAQGVAEDVPDSGSPPEDS